MCRISEPSELPTVGVIQAEEAVVEPKLAVPVRTSDPAQLSYVNATVRPVRFRTMQLRIPPSRRYPSSTMQQYPHTPYLPLAMQQSSYYSPYPPLTTQQPSRPYPPSIMQQSSHPPYPPHTMQQPPHLSKHSRNVFQCLLRSNGGKRQGKRYVPVPDTSLDSLF
jgi:hypothetical protein